jgi:hypothetical protein
VQGSTRNAFCQRADLSGGANVDTGFTHQPVVVLNPLALEGRGFRGLGAPDDVTGISDKDAHAEVASLRGRDSRRRVTGLICCARVCGDTRTVLVPASQLYGCGQPATT